MIFTRSGIRFVWQMALAALAHCQSSPDNAHVLKVELIGILRQRTEWGPPGFGESKDRDSKQRIFVLELASPKTAAQLSLPSVAGKRPLKVQEVQARCGDAAPANCIVKLASLVGRSIKLEGEVDYAIYPTDFLPLVINVTLISETERNRQNRR